MCFICFFFFPFLATLTVCTGFQPKPQPCQPCILRPQGNSEWFFILRWRVCVSVRRAPADNEGPNLGEIIAPPHRPLVNDEFTLARHESQQKDLQGSQTQKGSASPPRGPVNGDHWPSPSSWGKESTKPIISRSPSKTPKQSTFTHSHRPNLRPVTAALVCGDLWGDREIGGRLATSRALMFKAGFWEFPSGTLG